MYKDHIQLSNRQHEKGYFKAESPPFLHNSPTQNAAFLLFVASDDASSLSTNGITR